jgi:hypothetical protein
LVRSQFGENSGLIGAASLVHERLQDEAKPALP